MGTLMPPFHPALVGLAR